MQTFRTKAISRFADREGIDDATLWVAVDSARRNLVDADLGRGVIKRCIALKGGSRSGGLRTIVQFRRSERAFFVYGLAKSGRKNLRRDELESFRRLADEYLALYRVGLVEVQEVEAIIEMKRDDQAVQV